MAKATRSFEMLTLEFIVRIAIYSPYQTTIRVGGHVLTSDI